MGNNLGFEFAGKPATALVELGCAYVVHVKCPLKISGHYPGGGSARFKMGLPDAYSEVPLNAYINMSVIHQVLPIHAFYCRYVVPWNR